ncbi:hypothetical protein P170DRAFT_426074 [Aspergillus steynii IBT 23096]|uniref:Uncharacterized protein n=1 Tax=Aspergillus steynii IBT 23096 TaxID=1392250 RepID=A0A2I2G893_9EURO|nr:uncharacterized protein P170DRAFT_426074 [Aspergillus steynii IBT 23096]PLB49101.1 hypothetical protein P170DRAFT_426074 [Aspergillus steynii IBT 23096]
MCHYTLYHSSACGHITSFNMESCASIINSMRKGKSNMYCEYSSFSHHVVFHNNEYSCCKCDAETNAKPMTDIDHEWQKIHLEGMDLVSDGYPCAVSSEISPGNISKRTLSPMRCVIHRCLPMDIPYEPGCEPDEEQQGAPKASSAAPFKRPIERSCPGPAELKGDCPRAALRPTAACYAPLGSDSASCVSDRDYEDYERVLLSRKLFGVPSRLVPTPQDSLTDQTPEFKSQSPCSQTNIPDPKDDDFSQINAADANDPFDMGAAVDNDFVTVVQNMADSNIPTFHLMSAEEEKEAKPKKKARKQKPNLAPINTNLPYSSEWEVSIQKTPSSKLEQALEEAMSDDAPVPVSIASPKFVTPDYRKPSAQRVDTGLISPRQTSPILASPQKNYFQPPPPSGDWSGDEQHDESGTMLDWILSTYYESYGSKLSRRKWMERMNRGASFCTFAESDESDESEESEESEDYEIMNKEPNDNRDVSVFSDESDAMNFDPLEDSGAESMLFMIGNRDHMDRNTTPDREVPAPQKSPQLFAPKPHRPMGGLCQEWAQKVEAQQQVRDTFPTQLVGSQFLSDKSIASLSPPIGTCDPDDELAVWAQSVRDTRSSWQNPPMNPSMAAFAKTEAPRMPLANEKEPVFGTMQYAAKYGLPQPTLTEHMAAQSRAAKFVPLPGLGQNTPREDAQGPQPACGQNLFCPPGLGPMPMFNDQSCEPSAPFSVNQTPCLRSRRLWARQPFRELPELRSFEGIRLPFSSRLDPMVNSVSETWILHPEVRSDLNEQRRRCDAYW